MTTMSTRDVRTRVQILPSQLTDEDEWEVCRVSVLDEIGEPLAPWDDGFGPLWVYRESLGIVGVVRAQTWEDAYSCVVDEIMDDGDPADWDDDERQRAEATGALPEGYEYRSSGVPSHPRLHSAIARYDLNGERLDRLTDALAESLRLRVYRLEEQA